MERRVLLKRDYNVDDNNDYILVKEFLICGDEEHKELVLKLINTTNENCKDLKLIVHQLDKDGKEIALSTFESRYMSQNAGQEFVPKKAMTLKKECEDVVIELQFAAFQTAYYAKGELVPNDANTNKHFVGNDGTRMVKTRYFDKPILIALLVILSIITLVSYINKSMEEFKIDTKRFLYDNLYYNILDSKSVEVTGYNKRKEIVNVVVPETVGQYKVVEINNNAFNNCYSLNSLTIKGSVVIGDRAFQYCSGLANLNIQNVTYIGQNAFSGCNGLQSVTLNNLEFLGEGAFAGCSNLQSAVIENDNKLVNIRPYAFGDCYNLQTFAIKQDIESYSDLTNILYNCRAVRNLSLAELDNSTVTNLFGSFISLYDLLLETIEIGKIESVSRRMFANLPYLQKVTIGKVVSGRVEAEAFSGSYNLQEVNFENSITYIGQFAFRDTLIKTLNFNGVQIIEKNAFENSAIEKVNLSNAAVNTISPNTFNNCTNLKEVILNNSLENIGTNAFNNCINLENVQMSSSIKKIDEYAFNRCLALKAINLPEGLKTLGNSAFNDCQNLVKVNIPGTIGYIPNYAFSNCFLLDTVTIGNGIATIKNNAFANCYNMKKLEIADSVTYIEVGAFSSCNAIEYLKTPFPGCKVSDTATFYTVFGNGLRELKEVVITKAQHLNTTLFDGNQNLEKVTLQGEMYIISGSLFKDCINLKEVNLPSTIREINGNAFENCFNLRKITLPSGLQSIEPNAFKNTYRLWEVYNYSSINIIPGAGLLETGMLGQYTIAVYTSLDDEKMIFENVEDKFLFGHYQEKTYLLDYEGTDQIVELPTEFSINNVENPITNYEIYSLVFNNKEIESVVIPDGVTKIGNYAFGNCSKLEQIYLPATVTEIKDNSFINCPRLFEIYNLTDKEMTSGSSNHGYIAANALVIHKSLNELPLEKHTTNDNVEYRLDPNTLKGWIIGFKDEVKETINIGSRINTGGKSYNKFDIIPYAFYNTNIKTVNINECIINIGSNAFEACEFLEKVVINGNGLSRIYENAFRDCYELTTFTINSTSPLQTIGVCAFENTNIYNFTVPANLAFIGDAAFNNCTNLTYVINYSSLHIQAGNSNYGEIGYYAFDVVSSPSQIVTVDSGDFTFGQKAGTWYLIKFNDGAFDQPTIMLPDSFNYAGRTISNYIVWDDLTAYQFYYDMYIPLSAIKFTGQFNINIDNIYYAGNESSWIYSNHSSHPTLRYANILYYSNCVHDYSTWTYVNNMISTSMTSLVPTVIQAATCTKDGLGHNVCPHCSYYTEYTIYANGHNFNANNVCSTCKARRTYVTEAVFDSALFTNDPNYPYVFEDGVIKVPESPRYSHPTLTVNATQKMRIVISITSGSFGMNDKMTFSVNGYIQNTVTYPGATVTIELTKGDALEIIFNRNSSDNGSYAHLSMTIYYE